MSVVYVVGKESLKPAFIKQAADKLTQADKFLGSNPWFAGDKVSVSQCLHVRAAFLSCVEAMTV